MVVDTAFSQAAMVSTATDQVLAGTAQPLASRAQALAALQDLGALAKGRPLYQDPALLALVAQDPLHEANPALMPVKQSSR